MNIFAENLKCLRSQLKLSMQELATMASVSKSMICKIENNDVQPTLDIAQKIAAAFGKSLADMLEEDKPAQVYVLQKENQKQTIDKTTKIITSQIAPKITGTISFEHIQIPAKTTWLPTPALSAKANKYIFITKGKIEIHIECESYTLKPYDSITIEENFPFEIKNLSTGSAELIIHRS